MDNRYHENQFTEYAGQMIAEGVKEAYFGRVIDWLHDHTYLLDIDEDPYIAAVMFNEYLWDEAEDEDEYDY